MNVQGWVVGARDLLKTQPCNRENQTTATEQVVTTCPLQQPLGAHSRERTKHRQTAIEQKNAGEQNLHRAQRTKQTNLASCA